MRQKGKLDKATLSHLNYLIVSVLEEIFRKCKWEKIEDGIKIDEKFLKNLGCTDDVVLIGSTKEKLQRIFQSFIKISKDVELEYNIDKTKVMSISGSGNTVKT